MIVMKFGGTSVQVSSTINRLIEIVRNKIHLHPVIVVLKITSLLVETAEFMKGL